MRRVLAKSKSAPARAPRDTRPWVSEVGRRWTAVKRNRQTGDGIYLTLRSAIIDGVIPPGDRLAEIPLAGVFGRSRTPIREAVLRLQSERLVEYVPRLGLVVATVSREDIIEIYAVRAALDALAARLAAERIPSMEFDHLVWLNEQILRATEGGDFHTILNSSLEFHEALVRASGNRLLLHFSTQINDMIRRFTRFSPTPSPRTAEAEKEHDALLAAIKRGDGEAAARIAEDHILRIMQLRIAMRQSSGVPIS